MAKATVKVTDPDGAATKVTLKIRKEYPDVTDDLVRRIAVLWKITQTEDEATP